MTWVQNFGDYLPVTSPIFDPPTSSNAVVGAVSGACYILPSAPAMMQDPPMGGGMMKNPMMGLIGTLPGDIFGGGMGPMGPMMEPTMGGAIPPAPGPVNPPPPPPASPGKPGGGDPIVCKCVFQQQYPKTSKGPNPNGSTTHTVKFTYVCKKIPFGPPPPDPAVAFAQSVKGKITRASGTCGVSRTNANACAGSCGFAEVKWDTFDGPKTIDRRLIGPPPPPPTTEFSQGGSNLPSTPMSPNRFAEANRVTRGILGTNIPISAQVSNNPTAQNLPVYVRGDIIYDPLYNISIITDSSLLSLATNPGSSPIGDPNNLLDASYDLTLADILNVAGDINYTTPYNGLLVGAILYNSSLISQSLTGNTTTILDEVAMFNITSYKLGPTLQGALQRAAINGNFKYYSPGFLKSMSVSGKLGWPNGVPMAGNLGRALAFTLARNSKSSIFPLYYQDGDAQRQTQRLRVLPTDIDLTIPVKTRSGKFTGVRFRNNDGVPVTKQDGSVSYPKMKNEFIKVISNSKGEQTIPLLSNREIAYALHSSVESMVQGAVDGGDYSPQLMASSLTVAGGLDNVEISGGGSAIPTMILFSSVRESIRNSPAGSPMLRGTLVDYQRAWTSDDATNQGFNATVSAYSGPRASVYINSKDPIWDIILENGTLQILTTDFVEPVDGDIFVRKIFTDFLIIPTDVVTYDPFQGGSNLTTYVENQPIVRTFRMLLNPISVVRDGDYVKSTGTPDRTGPSGEEDIFSFQYEKGIDESQVRSLTSLNNTTFTSAKSELGKILNRISDINTNYNLHDGYKGKRLPMNDLLFSLTANQYVKFIQEIPSVIINEVYDGSYNNIKVFPVRLVDAEKTYLTSSRLIGTVLTNKVQETAISESRYFPPKYEGRLY